MSDHQHIPSAETRAGGDPSTRSWTRKITPSKRARAAALARAERANRDAMIEELDDRAEREHPRPRGARP